MRAPILVILSLAGACHGSATDQPDATGNDGGPDGATTCPAGKAGAACILALYDAAQSCDAAAVEALRGELDARANLGPLWAEDRALFRTQRPVAIAGTFDDWSTTAVVSSALCGSDLVLAVGPVATGFHLYKLVDGDAWSLDPANPAFAYDDFSGNPDGKNSALATPDSGRGYLVQLPEACSSTLGNCRGVTAYLPPGYDALDAAQRTYPVLFMHDGQNVWDDHDCCFGHTGWEVNVQLDADIAAGQVAPVIVIAAEHSTARNAEYGLDADAMRRFMEFQVTELQPRALAAVRWNHERVAVAGSSLGGLVAMELALRYPETYAAAASLSGAFWPGMDSGTALRDQLPALGKQPVAVYLDHGGDPATNSDGAADTIEVRDRMIGLGWQRSDSPSCTPGDAALCYHAEPGATHDELAWKARTWRFLRFLFPA
ncbi:MAG TPA: alpha/beta hydrolase-fold protein [Kofleriaceae bacterium]|nr:alpha/beta hydrolase-fold protein [Kofleriaceae bacterium]